MTHTHIQIHTYTCTCTHTQQYSQPRSKNIPDSASFRPPRAQLHACAPSPPTQEGTGILSGPQSQLAQLSGSFPEPAHSLQIAMLRSSVPVGEWRGMRGCFHAPPALKPIEGEFFPQHLPEVGVPTPAVGEPHSELHCDWPLPGHGSWKSQAVGLRIMSIHYSPRGCPWARWVFWDLGWQSNSGTFRRRQVTAMMLLFSALEANEPGKHR